LPLQRTELVEQAGLGAALIAGVATGTYHNLADACARTVRYGEITLPDTVHHATYNDYYARFQRLHNLLVEELHGLAG
jgi:sugar (pentulose or hexulose) kinase